jgi:hypothetical protein
MQIFPVVGHVDVDHLPLLQQILGQAMGLDKLEWEKWMWIVVICASQQN